MHRLLPSSAGQPSAPRRSSGAERQRSHWLLRLEDGSLSFHLRETYFELPIRCCCHLIGANRIAQPPPLARCRVRTSLLCTFCWRIETCLGFCVASGASS